MPEELYRQLEDLPAFRALVRATETLLLRPWPTPPPVVDLGCGDGHFAAMTFASAADVGVDPHWLALREAATRRSHRLLLRADGTNLPFPGQSVGTVVANSVLEHIPAAEEVLAEVVRVLRPQGRFYLTVPGPGFSRYLSVARLFEAMRLRPLAAGYRSFFNRVSRHVHVDPPEVWIARLEKLGLSVVASQSYLGARALTVVEWGHYFGFPLYLAKKVTKRFRPWHWRQKQAWLARWLAKVAASDEGEGAYWFFAAEKPACRKGG